MDENYLTRNYSQAETKDTCLFKGDIEYDGSLSYHPKEDLKKTALQKDLHSRSVENLEKSTISESIKLQSNRIKNLFNRRGSLQFNNPSNDIKKDSKNTNESPFISPERKSSLQLEPLFKNNFQNSTINTQKIIERL